MTALEYRSKADLVADGIREMIQSGEYASGIVLRQRDLAKRFDVSPTPVREALRKLESEGLVANEPHRGATVVRPDPGTQEEIYLLRAALEPIAAKLAAERVRPGELVKLVELHDEIVECPPHDPSITDLNRRFHLRIYECAGSPVLLRLIHILWNAIQGGPQVVWRPHRETVSQHEDMLAALRRRDAEGIATLTREHIQGAVAHMRRRVPMAE